MTGKYLLRKNALNLVNNTSQNSQYRGIEYIPGQKSAMCLSSNLSIQLHASINPQPGLPESSLTI